MPTRAAGLRNHRAGHVEDANLSSYSFDEQYNMFHRWAPRSWVSAAGRAPHLPWLADGLSGQHAAAEAGAAVRDCGVQLAHVREAAAPELRPPVLRSSSRCRSKGVAADPSGTEMVRHRDLVAAGKAEFETAAGGERSAAAAAAAAAAARLCRNLRLLRSAAAAATAAAIAAAAAAVGSAFACLATCRRC